MALRLVIVGPLRSRGDGKRSFAQLVMKTSLKQHKNNREEKRMDEHWPLEKQGKQHVLEKLGKRNMFKTRLILNTAAPGALINEVY